MLGDADLAHPAERALGTIYPAHRAVLTASGTAALALAIRGSHGGAADAARVALPAYCCPDLGSAALQVGASIALYDVDPSTLEPDLDSVRVVLAQGATHLVVAHLYGRIVDLKPVHDLVTQYGAVLIEDAAQHASGTLHGVRGGGMARWAVLSFGRGKGLNAGGGGALLSPLSEAPPPRLARPSRARGWRDLATTMLTQLLSHPAVYALPRAIPGLGVGDTVFHVLHDVSGASNATCALLPSVLQQEAHHLVHRRAAAVAYREMLSDRPALHFAPAADDAHQGALRYPIRLATTVPDAVERLGIVRSYPRTLAAYSQISAALVKEQAACPGAEALARTVYTLPTHSRIDAPIRGRVIDAVRSLTRCGE
jgi:dTDP-4-amino-4,6-dideoxygalactose transaminase